MIQLIPAIDIIEGKCVRLSQGKYDQKKVYNENALEVAKEFEAHGITRLHLVDLDGAKAKHIVNYKILEDIASNTNLCIDFGGGLKTDEDLKIAFECGASMVTGGSIAIKDAATFSSWINIYGKDKIILGADVKGETIALNGWTEESDCQLMPFLDSYIQKGIDKVICTDIAKDGMLEGPSIDLYKKILSKHKNLYLIASGGVSSMEDIAALESAGLPAVIFGKAIYEGRISLKQLESSIIQKHIIIC